MRLDIKPNNRCPTIRDVICQVLGVLVQIFCICFQKIAQKIRCAKTGRRNLVANQSGTEPNQWNFPSGTSTDTNPIRTNNIRPTGYNPPSRVHQIGFSRSTFRLRSLCALGLSSTYFHSLMLIFVLHPGARPVPTKHPTK